MSEKEKEKLKNPRLASLGNVKDICAQVKSIKSTEILNIDLSLLKEVKEVKEVVGKERFGNVSLMKVRSSPVAVKYFESPTKAWMVEHEATYLSQCCHLNLAIIIYGMNTTQQPYFIVTKFYGSDSFEAVTLYNIVN